MLGGVYIGDGGGGDGWTLYIYIYCSTIFIDPSAIGRIDNPYYRVLTISFFFFFYPSTFIIYGLKLFFSPPHQRRLIR